MRRKGDRFRIAKQADGGSAAEAIGESIFTEADSREEPRTKARKAFRRSISTRFRPLRFGCVWFGIKSRPGHETAA